MPTTMKNITTLKGRDSASHPLSIVRIEVERLFGKYSYVLEDPPGNLDLSSPLIILYGDNGSGKTTILKALFYLFSTDWEGDDISFFIETPFRRFSVLLADKTQVVASRDRDKLTGSFQLFFRRGKERAYELIYNQDEEGHKGHLEDKGFIDKLSNLNLKLFWMRDNRTVSSKVEEEDWFDPNQVKEDMATKQNLTLEINQIMVARFKSSMKREIALRSSIERAEDWLRDLALMGADKGTDNVHTIYEKIIEEIIYSSHMKSTKDEANYSPELLLKELQKQEKRSQEFARFGLITLLNNQKIIGLLKSNLGIESEIIAKVLLPYIDSINARFKALEKIQKKLAFFVDIVNNKFLRDKKIIWQVRDGIKIVQDSEKELYPEYLSSGEKQILILLFNTLTASNKATLFMIDEPEISLNIKWQRLFIRTLLELTKGSQVQFILATHSIELLSQYNRNVVELENLDEVRNEA